VRKRAEADRVGGEREAGVAPATVVRRRTGGWVILSSGVVLLLLGALFVGTPSWSEEDGGACGDEAALTLVLRPPADTSAACRDLAVEDTVLGGAMAGLGVAMVGWWWLRPRSSDEELASDELEDVPPVPRPRELLPIPELSETGLSPDRLVVHPYRDTGLLLATAAVVPFGLLQLARTLPPPDGAVGGFIGLLWEGWFVGYLLLAVGAATLLWWQAVAQLSRHPALVLDRHGLAAEDEPFVSWAAVAELIFGSGLTEDDEEVAVLELRLRPADDCPTSRTVRYELEGLSVDPEQIAALARSFHQRSSGSAPAEPTPEPDDVRSAWRIAAVLAAAAGLAVTSTWLGLLVAGGWPAALDF
jgi:hypothetical protein